MLTKPMTRRLVVVVLALNAGIATAKKPDKPAPPVDTTLVIGDSYTIRSERHGARQQLEGRLVKFNDRWLVLRHTTKARMARRVPVLSAIPGVGHRFRSAAVAAVDEHLWIPRDAAVVEAHAPAEDNSSPQHPMGEAPTLKVSCTVELAQADRVVRREGGLEAMTEQSLTLAVPRKVTVEVPTTMFSLAALFTADAFGKKKVENRYTREQLRRDEILCVRVAHFDPSLLTAQAR